MIAIKCKKCGSESVLRDAYAEWDKDKQEWVLQNVFDLAVCESDTCDGEETSLEEVPILPMPNEPGVWIYPDGTTNEIDPVDILEGGDGKVYA